LAQPKSTKGGNGGSIRPVSGLKLREWVARRALPTIMHLLYTGYSQEIQDRGERGGVGRLKGTVGSAMKQRAPLKGFVLYKLGTIGFPLIVLRFQHPPKAGL